MIEIKVNTLNVKDGKARITVESSANHSGTYVGFVAEMVAVLESLEQTDRKVFKDALHELLAEKIIDELCNLCDSEDEE